MAVLEQVNQKQREAIHAVEGPVMVVAGPGSGKTRVLTFRIAHLISIGVPAYQILALTFTNKAAAEMRERIVAIVGEKSRQLWMGTFHSILARILRIEAEKIGFDRNFTIYDTLDSLGLIKTIMGDLGIPSQQFNPQAIRSRISGAKNQMVLPSEYVRSAIDIFEEKTATVYAEYQKRLKLQNAMDFDDLLLKPIELFTRHKPVLEHYQERFRFILVDEYQDTNRTQYFLIKLLAQKYRNICVVGDDAQSIYSFRGADIRNILDFERDYPDAKIIRLEQNYRSTKNILSAADQVIKKNIDQITKNLWTENHSGEKITILACEDDRDEGAQICAHIHEEMHRLKLDFRDVAIMYRTNAQSRSLEDALLRNSIPYVIIGSVEFYQRKEVKDVMAYLRLLVNPRDNESFFRIVNYPNRGLGDVAIRHLKNYAEMNSLPLLEAAGALSNIPHLTQKAKASFTYLSNFFQKYIKLKEEMSISELSRSMVDELGILHLFKDEGTPDALNRWENVQELLSAITEYGSQQQDATLEQFLQEKSLQSDMDKWDSTHNAVTLMTLHSAKGLEFPVVFLVGLEEGLLPFYNSTPDRKELEEERRLYYVGMTRAMKKLYLSYARLRFRFAEMSYQTPSRFLEEINPELIEATHRSRRPTVARGVEEHAASPQREMRKKERQADHHLFSDEQPDYDHEPLEGLKAGTFVEHELFGRGKIIQIAGTGDMMKAVVDFPIAGRKNLMLKYARLRIV